MDENTIKEMIKEIEEGFLYEEVNEDVIEWMTEPTNPNMQPIANNG